MHGIPKNGLQELAWYDYESDVLLLAIKTEIFEMKKSASGFGNHWVLLCRSPNTVFLVWEQKTAVKNNYLWIYGDQEDKV